MEPLVIAQKGPSSHALASVQQISPRGKRYRQTNRITTLRAAKIRTVFDISRKRSDETTNNHLRATIETDCRCGFMLDTSIYRVTSSHASHLLSSGQALADPFACFTAETSLKIIKPTCTCVSLGRTTRAHIRMLAIELERTVGLSSKTRKHNRGSPRR